MAVRLLSSLLYLYCHNRSFFLCCSSSKLSKVVLHAFLSCTVDELHSTGHHGFPVSTCTHHAPCTLGKTRSSALSEILSNAHSVTHVAHGFLFDTTCSRHTFVVCFFALLQLLNDVTI